MEETSFSLELSLVFSWDIPLARKLTRSWTWRLINFMFLEMLFFMKKSFPLLLKNSTCLCFSHHHSPSQGKKSFLIPMIKQKRFHIKSYSLHLADLPENTEAQLFARLRLFSIKGHKSLLLHFNQLVYFPQQYTDFYCSSHISPSYPRTQ